MKTHPKTPFTKIKRGAFGFERDWQGEGELRGAFSDWYDQANNEQDEECVILAVRITKAFIFGDHGALRYAMDFANKAEGRKAE
ncbi:MAG: hypothetical protein LBD02_10805 [Christensenellaceae bacterium]|nr:hypothetical protein [Christensenellaceae bacterium]